MSHVESPYAHPEADCDLVMKGGVTSGVVFPPAVLQLAMKYRLRCIGGASAGAIAAAFTAAAEYARHTGGFERLETVSQELGGEGFIRKLFQPDRSTRPLFETLLSLSGAKGAGLVRICGIVLRLTGLTLRYYLWGYLLGAALGFGLWSLNLWAVGGSVDGWRAAFPVLFTALIAWLTGLTLGLRGLAGILQCAVPRNFFGLCNGFSNRSGCHVVMTDWLYQSLQSIAGKPYCEPLTMGDLAREEITFRMVSSNLSQGRPYSLPFRNHAFLFKRAEFAKLFPAEVVEWMVRHAHRSDRHTTEEGLYHLPPADQLPVVVAVRMSLSFPLLISAVPLYSVRPSAWKEVGENGDVVRSAHLHEQWFSDGGISSNFPIHLFDAWIPTRPTFGITLGAYPQNPPPGLDRVKLPKPTDRPFSGVEIESLWAFFNAIWNTAQNHRDNTQAALPSYRERVVQVLLSAEEGGLNLDMPPPVVKDMNGYGADAGNKLCTEFRFPAHQWVRLQVLMGALETQVRELSVSLDEGKIDPEALFAAQKQAKSQEFPFRRTSGAWCEKAKARLDALHALGRAWQEPVFTDDDAPAAEAVLRVTPDL